MSQSDHPGLPAGRLSCRAAALFALLLAAGFSEGKAGDWPQILGPERNGVAESEELLTSWPAEGPRVVWTVPMGSGFAGVAVQGDRVVAFLREANEEIVRCYSAQTGKTLWQSRSPCTWQGGVSGDKGPRCVPIMTGDMVITLGVEGRLRCLSVKDGQELWQRDTSKDFRPLEGYFGVGSTPLVHEGRVIVNVGGRDGAAVVAFDLRSGKTLWKSFDDHASYSSPVMMHSGKTPLAVVVTRMHVVGIAPASGDVVFSAPFGARGPTVNGATPVILDDRVFVTSSYHIGSLLLSVSSTGAEELWRDANLLASQYATPVALADKGDVLIAVDGRQDGGAGSASLKCIDAGQQKVLWEESGFDYGTLIRVNREYLMLTCGGELIRFPASTSGYQQTSRHQVLRPTDSGYRLPAISNGRLFVRDDVSLKCLEVGRSSESPREAQP